MALMAILIVGTFLRFQHFGDIVFDREQSYPIWQALKTLDNGQFPLAGQDISDIFPHPPLMGYIFLPFLVIGRDFIVIYLVTLTLNSLAMWLAYRGLQWLIGTQPALIGAALFAVSPWLIEDSRQISLQSLFPFFVCLIFWALTSVLAKQTKNPDRQLLIALVGLAIFANTYLLAYAMVAPVGAMILLFWRRIPRRSLLIGAGIFIGFLMLYLIGLAEQWQHTRPTIDEFFQDGSKLSSESLGHAVRLVTGWEYAAARGVNAPQHDAIRRADISNVVHWMWTVLLVVGILKAVYYLILRQKIPQQTRDVSLILLVWFLLPILMMSYVSQAVHPFYLMLSVPAGHGLAAWAIAPLLRWRIGIWGIVGGLLITGGINGINSMRFAQETAAYQGKHIPYTLPLEEAREVGEQLRNGYEDRMVVYTPIDESMVIVLTGQILPVVHGDEFEHMMVIPPEGGLYMTFHRGDEGLNPPMHSQIVGLPVRFDDGTRAVVWEARQDFKPRYQTDIPSDIGVRFIGWWLLDPIQAGKTVELRMYWQADGPADPNWSFTPYAHVFDRNGNRVFIADGLLLPLQTWQVDDWVVQTLSLSVPSDSVGPFSVNIGLFDSKRMTNAIFNFPEDGEQVFTPDISIIPME
jgi:hypothetical protein